MSTPYQEPLIVIFGGAGYIGSVLVRQLLDEEFSVRVVDNFSYGNDGLNNLNHPRLEIVEGDLCNTHTVSNTTRGAHAVVLLSAIIGRRFEDKNRRQMRDINFLASSVALDAAIEHGVDRFIFSSSDSVYGAQPGVMYETGTPEPVSLYSRLKLRMEERVINSKRRGFHPTALRIGTCHGASPRMRFDILANTMLRDAVVNKKIKMEGGDQWRPLIHVSDAARSIVLCLKAHTNLISGELFNVGSNDQNLQVKHVAHAVKKTAPEAEIEIVDAEPDLTDYHLSCSKIEKILDFESTRTLEDSLEEMKSLILEGTYENPYDLKYHNN